MLNPKSLQLRVGVDVGSRCRSVAIGLSDDQLLEEFEVPHTMEGVQEFVDRGARKDSSDEPTLPTSQTK